MGPDCARQVGELVEKAGKLALNLRENLRVEHKPDGSLVTNADREVERLLRAELARLVPGAAFWGEESPFEEPSSEGIWLVDPIDGTSNFAFGQPLWGVTVGLLLGGRLTVGAVSLPDLGWHFSAGDRLGARFNGEPLPQLDCRPALPHELIGTADEDDGPFASIPGKRRHLGSFVAEAMFMARGGFRAMVATKAKLYDAAGSIVVLREVGATVTKSDGQDFNESDWLKPVRCEPFLVAAPGVLAG